MSSSTVNVCHCRRPASSCGLPGNVDTISRILAGISGGNHAKSCAPAHYFAMPAWMLVIDVLDDRRFFQVGGWQAPCQGAVFFPKPLLVDQQREAFFEAELGGLSGFQLSAEKRRQFR